MTPAAHQPLSLDKQIQLEQLKHSNLQLQLELMRAQLELAKLSPNVQITVTCVPILRGGFIFCSIIMACLSSHPMSRSQILIFLPMFRRKLQAQFSSYHFGYNIAHQCIGTFNCCCDSQTLGHTPSRSKR